MDRKFTEVAFDSCNSELTVTESLARVATLSTTRLLDVVGRTATTPAQRVGLIMPFSKAGRTFRLKCKNEHSVCVALRCQQH